VGETVQGNRNQRKRLGSRIINGLRNFHDTLESGRPHNRMKDIAKMKIDPINYCVLENWSFFYLDDGYTAPETLGPIFYGNVYGSLRFPEGCRIQLGPILGYEDHARLLRTKNSFYRLGNVLPAYEQAFPDAAERVHKQLLKVFGK
jgi:hypothetical protein